jgi:hypothetical protein
VCKKSSLNFCLMAMPGQSVRAHITGDLDKESADCGLPASTTYPAFGVNYNSARLRYGLNWQQR